MFVMAAATGELCFSAYDLKEGGSGEVWSHLVYQAARSQDWWVLFASLL